MKARILGLALTFTMLVALVVPSAAAMGYYNSATVGSYNLSSYDVRYVTMKGSDTTGAGTTEADAWRTITFAISQLPFPGGKPDLIWVGESAPLYYGGAVPENIVVDEPVVIWAPEGSDDTIINVVGQGKEPLAVVTINASPVTIDGFTLMGSDTGVLAFPDGVPTGEKYLGEVKILNNIIKAGCDRFSIGVDMVDVKYPTIDNNHIIVDCTAGASGIEVVRQFEGDYIGFKAMITDNLLDINGKCVAEGILLDGYPNHSVIDDNTLNILAGLDVFASGIKAEDSPLVEITDNVVNVTATGNCWTVDYGIKVRDCDKALVKTNTVTVAANMVGQEFGFLFARGIVVKCSHESAVLNNTVAVNGAANANNTTVLELAGILGEDELEDLADLSDMTTQTNGLGNWSVASGTVIGIKVKGSEDVDVCNNVVNPVKLDLFVRAADDETAAAGAAGMAAGILACGSAGLLAQGNTVDATADVEMVADTITNDVAMGGAVSVAFGIALGWSPDSVVSTNGVTAKALLEADVKSVTSTTQDAVSALSRFDAEVIGAVNAALADIAASESVNVQLTGEVARLQNCAASGVLAMAFGVGVLESDCTVVANNTIWGEAALTSDVWARTALSGPVGSVGAGLSLGAGVAVIGSRSAVVCDNDVTAKGDAYADIGAQHDTAASPTTGNTYADGCLAGVGVGILLCGADMYPSEAVEGQTWSFRPVVEGNKVRVVGEAEAEVSAVDLVKSHDSCAMGCDLGLGIGIAAVYYPCVLIKDNDVDATGDADVNTYAEAVHAVDPLSSGAAAGIGLGIATVVCPGAEINGNVTVGKGYGYAEVGATEKAIITDANAVGAATGLGEGIFVSCSPWVLVTGNSVARGFGEAKAKVEAENFIPADYASALGLAGGHGIGIGVYQSPFGRVVDCNTAAGVGDACAIVDADADFSDECKLAAEVSVDILWSLIDKGDFVWDAGRDRFTGHVNYNSMVDHDTEANADSTHWKVRLDAGLYKIGPCGLDAKYNWWNDPTGPSGFGPGDGEAVLWCGDEVCYEPWLYVVHTKVLSDQLGYFGFTVPIVKGVNTLSTPIALDASVVGSRTWAQIVANSDLGGKIKYAKRWDSATQMWAAVTENTTLEPLDAWYVYFYDSAPKVVILMASVESSLPTRTLKAGWNLIGPNPQFPDRAMSAQDVLASVELTPAGLPGYTQAISPVVKSQERWIYTGGHDSPWMWAGRGYWVFMENQDILAGYGFTPLPDKFPYYRW